VQLSHGTDKGLHKTPNEWLVSYIEEKLGGENRVRKHKPRPFALREDIREPREGMTDRGRPRTEEGRRKTQLGDGDSLHCSEAQS